MAESDAEDKTVKVEMSLKEKRETKDSVNSEGYKQFQRQMMDTLRVFGFHSPDVDFAATIITQELMTIFHIGPNDWEKHLKSGTANEPPPGPQANAGGKE